MNGATAAAAKPSNELLDQIAARLQNASDDAVAVAPVRDELPAADIAAAYAVQDRQTRARLDAGWRLVGRKIGLTAKSVQNQLGVDQPDFGMLFDRMSVPDGESVPRAKLIAPKCEAEIAFVLCADLDYETPTLADALRAVAYALPAIEIVDSRIADWNIGIVDTVADNASSARFVLGSRATRLEALDLHLCGMTLSKNGIEMSYGTGAACLGSPLTALLWLAAKMYACGRPLRAGDIVLSGALGPMVSVSAGDVFEARIGGLGSVRVAFTGER